MKKLTNLFILMILGSSMLFAQINKNEQIENKDRITNTDVDPNAKVNPHATTFTDGLFDHQFDFPVSSVSGQRGIETNGNYIYTSRWYECKFYCYEMDGTYIGYFYVSGISGVRDMAYDGTYFYGTAANTTLYEMDFEGVSGTLISTLSAAVDTRACAYDPDYDAFWGNNWTSPITLYDRTGNIINQFFCGAHGSYYGFAYLNDAGNEWLYGFAQSGGINSCDIVQIDPVTGDETGVVYNAIEFSSSGTGIAGGLAAFDTYVPGYWTLLGVIQDETIFGVEGGTATPQPDIDLKITGIIEPNDGFGLGIENIIICIKNGGTITQSNFEVRYSVDSCAWITETVTGPIQQGETIEFTFITPYDFSEIGEHFIESEVIIPGDEIPSNNYRNKTIENWGTGIVCHHTITMWDDYGDGWNGGYVQIFGDGVELFNGTLASGSGPETFEFFVYQGTFLTAVFTPGGWPEECSYQVYAFHSDYLIFEDGIGGVAPEGGDIGYGSCEVFDAGISEIYSPENGMNLGNEVVTVNLLNYGYQEIMNIPVGFTVDNDTMIMEIASGPISYGSSYEYTFTALADLSEPGQHNIEVCTFLDGDGNSNNDCLEKNIFNYSPINIQEFDLSHGYQFISSFTIPMDPDLLIVLEDILYDNLDFVRNSQGQTLRKIGPNWVNNIGDWIIEEGYLVKMFSEDSFTIEGELVNPSTPISVVEGYQFVSYFPATSIDAMIAYESIIGDNLDLIRNSNGQTLRKIGPIWVNGIGDCFPSEGYIVKMNAADELIYPAILSFICGDTLYDPRDGQIYNTIQIGDQCWMAENLNIGYLIPGNQDMSNNGVIEKYCYSNNFSFCDQFGGLYQWDEVMQYTTNQGEHGICPDGWFIPTDDDWKILEGTVDSQYPVGDTIWNIRGWRGYDVGLNLKFITGWYANGNGTNNFGFSALPGGYRMNNGEFSGNSTSSYFWSSTEEGSDYACSHALYYSFNKVNRIEYDELGFSVRCMKDESSVSSRNMTPKSIDEKVKNHIVNTDYYIFEGGNPADPVYTIYIDDLNIGDEVAAFDGETLIGAMKINSENKFENELPLFSTINSGQGYTPGNPIILKVWDKSENKECILKDYTFSNPYEDAWTENVFPADDGEYSLLHFSTTGISDENELTHTISIYPNPSEGIFNISIEGVSGKVQIKVFDVHGNDYRFFEIEGTKNMTTEQLDLKELAVGIYFISFRGKNLNQVRKIVIQ
jgi:uncharacterized protein (TIGR02145 family)